MLDGTIVADACSWEKDAKAKLQSTSDKVGSFERMHSTPRGLRRRNGPARRLCSAAKGLMLGTTIDVRLTCTIANVVEAVPDRCASRHTSLSLQAINYVHPVGQARWLHVASVLTEINCRSPEAFSKHLFCSPRLQLHCQGGQLGGMQFIALQQELFLWTSNRANACR